MQGNEKIDNLMLPVSRALERHVKDRDAKTEIYNRAYEALMDVMDALNIAQKRIGELLAEKHKWRTCAQMLADELTEANAKALPVSWEDASESSPAWIAYVNLKEQEDL